MERLDILKIFDNKLIDQINKITLDEIEYWDLRVGITKGTTIEFTNQKSKEISNYEINKCGLRTFINGGWGFYVLNEINKDVILMAFKKKRDPLEKNYKIHEKNNLLSTGIEEKIQIVKDHERKASEFSNKIKNTKTIYTDGSSSELFLNSFGSNIYLEIPILRLFSLVYAKDDGIIQRAINSVGGLGGFEILQTDKARNLSRKSAEEAVNLLNAKSPVGGKFTVIMDPKLTGTFVHEAFGHAVEADHVLGEESILLDKISQKIAMEDVTIVDDPRMGQGKRFNLPYELFGSYFIDSEGILSQETVIVEDGILKNYLHSLETASRMNVEPNGHGRATSPSLRPQARMGITVLKPGNWSLEEMIKDTKNGILCEKEKELMRDVALSGMTLETLNRITALGKELSYSDGMCGKGGQSVRVCDGGPYIRVDNVTVGGLS
ncbi:MAG: TldD/PmbA family protein [Candidatus Lokiarchaeota archaeon]